MITLGKAGRLSAEDALRISLVSEVVAPDHLLDRARELTAEAAKASPTTLPGPVATDIAVSAGRVGTGPLSGSRSSTRSPQHIGEDSDRALNPDDDGIVNVSLHH